MKRLMGLSAIVYLVSSFTICTVRAELFELLEADYENSNSNSNETGNNNDFIGEAISGVKQYFGSLTEDDQSNNKTATAIVSQQSDSEPLGLTDEVDMALKHATDTADGLWQQFKKGLLSLMGSFSAGDGDGDGDGNGDIDGYNATAMGVATPTQTTRATMTGTTTLPMTTTTEQSSLQQMKPIANQTSAIIEDLTTTTSKPIPFPLRPTTTTTSTTIAPPTNTTITP